MSLKYFLKTKCENQSPDFQFSTKLGNNCCQIYELFVNGTVFDLDTSMFLVFIFVYVDPSFLALIYRSIHLSFLNNSYATTAYFKILSYKFFGFSLPIDSLKTAVCIFTHVYSHALCADIFLHFS